MIKTVIVFDTETGEVLSVEPNVCFHGVSLDAFCHECDAVADEGYQAGRGIYTDDIL